MPTKVEKRGNKYRVVDIRTGNLTKNRYGTPIDGGGYSDRVKAQRQATAINIKRKK